MSTPGWDFDYRPSAAPPSDAAEAAGADFVLAFGRRQEPGVLARALDARLGVAASVEVLLEREPIYWYRIRAARVAKGAEIFRALEVERLRARYVAPATAGSPLLGEPLETRHVVPARPRGWKTRPARGRRAPEPPPPWHLEEAAGVAVDRARFGRGGGRRLAVVDDDARGADVLDLDAEVLVGVEELPRAHCHGALMVAWAAGARGRPGVAPDASARIYYVPKSGTDVVSVPRAIVLAALDGADVILCPTHLEGSTSPMLDDALEFATRLGRRGRGSVVVIPTGRDASSPPGSLHASLTLALSDPASDPRVLCVGPSARDGGWFLWRSRRGTFHPFANRGPALSLLAPGDDLDDPLGPPGQRAHAESSGAAALAAGVALLALDANPALRGAELLALLRATAAPVPADAGRELRVEPKEMRPPRADRDGHSAKHGYGRAHAGRACLAASDPFARALVELGEDDAARRWLDALASLEPRPYTKRLARWAARALLADGDFRHTFAAMARHLRLVSGSAARRRCHRGGAARQLILIVRALRKVTTPEPPPAVAVELARLEARAREIGSDAIDDFLFELASSAFDRGASRLLSARDRTGEGRKTPAEVAFAECVAPGMP